MINKINIIKNNIKNKKVAVLGAGVSGQGAAMLADFMGAKVLVSDIKRPKKLKYNKILNSRIKFEFGKHSNKCLNADLIIISPGININNNSFLKKILGKKIPIISEIEFSSWYTKSPIIAITGSNGKSTVVKILHHIFIKQYKNTLLGGNIGVSFALNVIKELKSKENNLGYTIVVMGNHTVLMI